MSNHDSHFTTAPDGQPVERFTLTNSRGLIARVLTYGATLAELHVPDRDGQLADVVLGFDEPAHWVQPHPFFGVIAGRFANRVARGTFVIDGKTFTLGLNDGSNHLHGGLQGFDKVNWRVISSSPSSVQLRYTSPDGEEGYPGNLETTVTYTLTEENELRVEITATTDAPTIVNLTNHAYFNLGASPDILGHELTLHAGQFTEVNDSSIPTGELPAVNSVMDFTKAKVIGRDIAALSDAPGGGYDHNWVINDWAPGKLVPAAELHDPTTGRTLRITTTEPGIQFYTGNYVQDVTGKGGRVYQKFAGLCLETQHFPDAPNNPHFPSTVLRPGETFRSTTVFAFGVR